MRPEFGMAVRSVSPNVLSVLPNPSHPKGQGPKGDKDTKLKEVCQEFESLFVYHLLKVMRESSPKSSLWGEGLGGQFYQSLFDLEIARKISLNGGIGLADVLYRSLKDKSELTQGDGSHGTTAVKQANPAFGG